MKDVLFETNNGIRFLANNKALATKIANMFGQTSIEYVKPSIEELTQIKKALERYKTIKQKVVGLGYSGYLQLYLDYGGYDAQIVGVSLIGFTFDFAGFQIRLIFQGESSIDEREIVYKSETFHRTYIIRQDGATILVGSL